MREEVLPPPSSFAMTFVEYGGSFIWLASVGNDHNEGEDLKRDVGLCERSDPNPGNLVGDDGEPNASAEEPCP